MENMLLTFTFYAKCSCKQRQKHTTETKITQVKFCVKVLIFLEFFGSKSN